MGRWACSRLQPERHLQCQIQATYFSRWLAVFSNTEMSLKEDLSSTPKEGSSQPALISRSSMVLKSD